MRGLIDLSSISTIIVSILVFVLIIFLSIGIRLLIMQTIQQKRERENRQINERLRTLISAYKTLGGSFTGNISVSPIHLRDIKRESEQVTENDENATSATGAEDESERRRRIRDAVEGALSDIILLGTDEQVQLAANAASELTAGRPIHTAELVVSLRDFIRKTLGLAPIPHDLSIPKQGPTRPTVAKSGRTDGGGQAGGGAGGRGGGGAGGMGMAGAGIGMGAGFVGSDTAGNK